MAEGGAVRVGLGPSWFAAAARSLLVLGALLLVAAIMLGAKGTPQSSRDVRRDEIAHYAPRLVAGVADLGIQMLLVVGLTWACRGPLRIRLESAEVSPVLDAPLRPLAIRTRRS
jgi:TRAP-type C4-dicarboxylate transport system permease small subunit